MLAFFSSVIFLNAFLLFIVQPMFAKTMLPLLGGAPSVWTTCMLFFQAALLLGYLYAHGSVAALGVRRQVVMHAAILVLSVALFNGGVGTFAAASEGRSPVPWLIGVMTASIGLPFLLLSTTAPLLQRWFAATPLGVTRDPYFLYAASNAGSLAGLLAYPAVIEPFLSLGTQHALWGAGYAVNGLLVAACAWFTHGRALAATTAATGGHQPPLAVTRRLRWVLVAFIPSGLMLAVTSHISTDIAAVPLLWIAPLALYLLSFVMAFSGAADRWIGQLRRLLPILLVPLVLFLASQTSAALFFVIPLHLGTFLLIAILCHAELARDRPPPSQLTEFYVWLAVGGVLGGVFNTIVAPTVFRSVVEYPILIGAALVALAAPAAWREFARLPRAWVRPAAVAVTAGAAALLVWRLDPDPSLHVLVLVIPAFLSFSVSRKPASFAVAIVLWLAASLAAPQRQWEDLLFADRSFFGVYRVAADDRFVSLFHGTTVHGRQAIDGDQTPEPLTYYHRDSPVADVLHLPVGARAHRVGVVGLGVGSLAAYARPDQQWTFYEIDPLVERVARDRRFFTFLETCGSACAVSIGDGRLLIAAAPDPHDILILDAFSSDAIPVHLLTSEAFDTYLSRLSRSGVIVLHISNRHFDLEPMLGRLAAGHGLHAVSRFDSVPHADSSGRESSRWVALSLDLDALAGLNGDRGWNRLFPGEVRAWTDDYSNIWSVLRWKGMP